MIQVNEIFGPTIQGEGKSAGKPCAFLRLATCNLHCIWCDTPYTWSFSGTNSPHAEVFNREDEVHKMTDTEILEKLESFGPKFLVISGGEPFLQQKQLLPLIRILKSKEWWIEVETNGTVPVNVDFVQVVDQINCSPKLANALDLLRLRRRPQVLRSLSSCEKVNFKFVIQTKEDLEETLEVIHTYELRQVRLMPECRTKEELLDKEVWLKEICKTYDFIYCTRLSILQSGTKRGV